MRKAIGVRVAVAALATTACGAASSQTTARVPPTAVVQTVAPDAFATMPTYRLWAGCARRAGGAPIDGSPTLTMVRPMQPAPHAASVLTASGGGYVGLAATLASIGPAHWFAAHGIVAFVSKYRVGSAAKLTMPSLDGQRAIRSVRANAKALGIDPQRIAMIGFLASGHLAASALPAIPPRSIRSSG